MNRQCLMAALVIAIPFSAMPLPAAAVAPQGSDLLDALGCKLEVPDFNGFAMSVSGGDGLAKARHWVKIETGNPFLSEYELPAPITVAGYATRRIAFSSGGILAVLDEAEPEKIARLGGIVNQMDPEPLIQSIVASGKATRAQIDAYMRDEVKFRKFLGEKVILDRTELPAKGASFGTHSTIAHAISNATTHPGKTLYGCSYRIELVGRDGKPL